MKLYDNDAYRDEFMEAVYNLLSGDSSNDRANQVIDLFDAAPAVETEPAPLNDPLTLEELREMDGEPVFLTPIQSACTNDKQGAWALVDLNQRMCRVSGGGLAVFENCGKTWMAYRYRPQE